MFTVADHLITTKKRRKLEAENLPPKLRVPTLRIPQEVDLEDYVSRPEKISCADIAAICQEAGMCLARGWGRDGAGSILWCTNGSRELMIQSFKHSQI
jgi:hypothetical protein